jgi:hypothetical protein
MYDSAWMARTVWSFLGWCLGTRDNQKFDMDGIDRWLMCVEQLIQAQGEISDTFRDEALGGS